MITVNGEKVKNITGKTVAEYLAEIGCDMRRIAIEVNEEIILKQQYESTILRDGDNVEIVSFVGGG